MRNREFWKGTAAGFLAASVIAAAGCAGYASGIFSGDTALSDYAHIKKLNYLEDLVDTYYLEEKDEDEVAEGLYAGLIYGLGDPYSCYYTAEEYEQENSSTMGIYVGIGVVMQKNRDGGVKIVQCYEGGPGKIAGIETGDIISEISGTDITDKELQEVVDTIKAMEGENAVLTIHRENVEEALEITVPVENVELPSVFHEMLDAQTGYLRITEFKGVTYQQYLDAYADLADKGMEKLVVDLRDNPGGMLKSVCDILRRILPEGLIVYTEDKNGVREEQTCDGENPLSVPLAVMVNEGSASASEIFAGAVQDYGVGTIVGTVTYGKGVVQSILPINDGSAVKLTVSNYYTPKGKNIHKVGIKPDVEVKLDVDLLNKNSFSHEEDNQLQEALKVLR